MTGGQSASPGRRLDLVLVDRGLARSRAGAQELLRSGEVLVDGTVVRKASMVIAPDRHVAVASPGPVYVSRGGRTLAYALDHFGIDPAGRTCLDIGASTGGFTDVLLRRRATRVYAIDVGHGQLAAAISSDPRVVAREKTDARSLTAEMFGDPITLIAADVSFISLTLALPAALALAAPGADLVALIKPQFELTPADIGKGGIVGSEEARLRAVARVTGFLADRSGWAVRPPVPSPITGGDGNVEYLIGAHKEPRK